MTGSKGRQARPIFRSAAVNRDQKKITAMSAAQQTSNRFRAMRCAAEATAASANTAPTEGVKVYRLERTGKNIASRRNRQTMRHRSEGCPFQRR